MSDKTQPGVKEKVPSQQQGHSGIQADMKKPQAKKLPEQKQSPTPSKGPMVVLIPPLLVPWPIMIRMYWAAKKMGRRAVIFKYPSYRKDIPDNANRLAAFLRDLDEPEVDVIAFSLGNIILRWATNHCDVPKIRRVVMLGPPNQGAEFADILHQKLGFLFPLFWGKCALQLRKGDKGLAARAGLMPEGTQVGVIAGGTGKDKGLLPIVKGDNDRTVAVSETILSGMNDFILVPHGHGNIPLSKRPINLTCQFLETGRFREAKVKKADSGKLKSRSPIQPWIRK